MPVKFTEFWFTVQSERNGTFALEAPIGTMVLENFPFNPGAIVKLDPHVENADSARLIVSIKKDGTVSQLVVEPQTSVVHQGATLQNYIAALHFEFSDQRILVSARTECELGYRAKRSTSRANRRGPGQPIR
jgi:hypothetical protein